MDVTDRQVNRSPGISALEKVWLARWALYDLAIFGLPLIAAIVALQFVGYEQEDEGIESYFQVNNVAAVKKISITDNILYDWKKEQVSVLHVTVGGKRQSTKINNPEDKVSFEF